MEIDVIYELRGDDVPRLPIRVVEVNDESYRFLRLSTMAKIEAGDVVWFVSDTGKKHYINGKDIALITFEELHD